MHLVTGLDGDAQTVGLAKKEIDDGVGVLRLREDAMVVLGGELDTAMLEPFEGIAVVKLLEEALQ